MNAKNLRYLIWSTKEVQILRMKKLSSDLYSSDEENNYFSLDISLNVLVSVAYFSWNKSSSTLTKKAIKQILHKQIKKKDGYVAPKNV